MSGHTGPLPQPVRSDSLANQLFSILKEAIFTGKFKPGEALRELQIARSMSVSQATVREALTQLEQAGLVTRSQTRRTTVTSFTQDEVRDRLALRVALEQIAFVKAAPNLTPADVDMLQVMGNEIDETAAGGDCLNMTFADMRFHRFVWEKADSPITFRMLDQLTTPLFAFIGVLHSVGMHDLRSGRPHSDLIGSLKTGVPDMIRSAVTDHIQGSYRPFLESGKPSLDLLIQKTPELSGHLR